MGEGRIKYQPLKKSSTNSRLHNIVNFGTDTNQSGPYYDRIKRIMKKLKEISSRIDKLASQM